MEKIRRFVKSRLGLESTGHDYYHAKRVAKLAEKIYMLETDKVDASSLKIILASSYLHDTIDAKIAENTEEVTTEIKIILKDDYTTEEIEKIFDIIDNISYSKNIDKKQNLSLEGKIVQDADRLDALGAIGIARAFAFGGKNNNLMHNPNILPKLNMTKQEYKEKSGTTINHFYEKLFSLETLMNTKTGKELARERTEYMKNFVDEFLTEWNFD